VDEAIEEGAAIAAKTSFEKRGFYLPVPKIERLEKKKCQLQDSNSPENHYFVYYVDCHNVILPIVEEAIEEGAVMGAKRRFEKRRYVLLTRPEN